MRPSPSNGGVLSCCSEWGALCCSEWRALSCSEWGALDSVWPPPRQGGTVSTEFWLLFPPTHQAAAGWSRSREGGHSPPSASEGRAGTWGRPGTGTRGSQPHTRTASSQISTGSQLTLWRGRGGDCADWNLNMTYKLNDMLRQQDDIDLPMKSWTSYSTGPSKCWMVRFSFLESTFISFLSRKDCATLVRKFSVFPWLTVQSSRRLRRP